MTNSSTLVGHAAPSFEMPAVSANQPPTSTALADYRGRWLALLFYPRDFSFVCPTELTAFSARIEEFAQRNCELLGVSVDTIDRHQQWLQTPACKDGLDSLRYPLASDPSGVVSRAYGAWDAAKEVSLRGLFLIDPDGVLQYAVVHNLSVGRSVDEVVRVLDALQTGGLCPASWTRADGTIDVEQALSPGRVLGHYRIEKKLGAGAFGAVFAARDERLDREVAIKVLKKNALESLNELTVEARAAAKIQHPNICTLYAIEQEDGLPLISMERIDGRSLADLIQAGLSENQRNQIAIGIAAGLEAAHSQNLTHGDLKPANILVLETGVPKILDFGLAQTSKRASDTVSRDKAPMSEPAAPSEPIVDRDLAETLDATQSFDSSSSAAATKRIYGTPLYMSPEQSEGEPITAASDVFSFGLLLFEMLTGRKALPEQSLDEIISQLQSPSLADELSAEVAQPHREILAAMLAKDPSVRPTMQVVANMMPTA